MKNKVVLDTNVLLVSISSKSQYHWIFQALLKNQYQLFFSNNILTEYEEIIKLKYNQRVAEQTLETLVILPNTHIINVYYRWKLIEQDQDDNKFVDCAIAANADCLVTQDKHFNVLKSIDFPQVTVMSVAHFKEYLTRLKNKPVLMY